jgi:hypothetical protein
MRSNSMDHGGRRCHTAAMGPHSRQQSIQQSTNIICDRSTSLKLENNVFITSNITINACRVDDEDATTIASLASSPPSHCRLPCNAAPSHPSRRHAPCELPCSCPSSRRIPEAVDCRLLLMHATMTTTRMQQRSPPSRRRPPPVVASLATLLPLIPHVVKFLASCLARVPRVIASRKQLIVKSSDSSSVNHQSPQY